MRAITVCDFGHSHYFGYREKLVSRQLMSDQSGEVMSLHTFCKHDLARLSKNDGLRTVCICAVKSQAHMETYSKGSRPCLKWFDAMVIKCTYIQYKHPFPFTLTMITHVCSGETNSDLANCAGIHRGCRLQKYCHGEQDLTRELFIMCRNTTGSSQ